MRGLTTEEFIKKARQVHGDKYDYSKVEYVNACTKVCIICPIHGEFWQSPTNHLRGKGCSKCSGKYEPSTEEFIEKARKVHGDKYDYSKVEYANAREKVCIICKEHGEFWQKPRNHLSGNGCPKCGLELRTLKRILTTEEFIEKARKVHGDKYDYSKTEYVYAKEKVCIICPHHGEFWQKSSNHLNGKGCPKCSSSKMENEIRSFLIDNNIEFDEQARFEWLGLQSLDFFLPKYNIAIECQGIQHFESIEHFGGDNHLIATIERDKRKKSLCEENGIRLLYYSNLDIEYPYDVFESKEELLKEIVMEYNYAEKA